MLHRHFIGIGLVVMPRLRSSAREMQWRSTSFSSKARSSFSMACFHSGARVDRKACLSRVGAFSLPVLASRSGSTRMSTGASSGSLIVSGFGGELVAADARTSPFVVVSDENTSYGWMSMMD